MTTRRAVAAFAAACVVGVAGGAVAVADSAAPGSREGTTVRARLALPPPPWYTPEVHRRAREAAERGAAIPLPDDAHVPTTSLLFPGIRPGARMVWPSGCTLNYVFGTGARLSVGTAGHCARKGQEVTIVAAPGVLLNIGTVVRSVARGIGDDFALIRIRPQLRRQVTASIAYVGGPTGKATPGAGDLVVHAGHGTVIGYGGTPRAGVVSYRRGTGFGWRGAAGLGDSGSPVRLLDGRAAGALTHVILDSAGLPTGVAGTTIARMEQLAGLPLAVNPPLPTE
jgi:hypothetical protein